MSNEQTMQKSRPQTSQAVIDGFTRIIDSQDEKGLAKYGRDIDDAKDKDWDWKLMALEEAADYSKYLIKEIKRLEAENANIEKMREMLNVQGQDGNWNYNEYMLGMYNGMEFMLSLAENREPEYKNKPEQWLKDSQKEEAK